MCLRFFKKMILKSNEQTHWINHIYDETIFWPNKAAMWCNLHGFDEGPGQTYWIGMDFRSFGIRTADYVIKCKNKTTYDRYIERASKDIENVLNAMKHDPDLNVFNGNNVGTEFIFRWGGASKSFNVRLGWDYYAEER